VNKIKKIGGLELGLVSLFIFLYSLAASLVSLNRFWQYNAFWYDFGIFDTTIWQLAHFQLPIITQLAPPLGKVVWADHFNPSAIFLAPLYWFTDRPEIILVAQAVSVGLSAFIGYLLAKKFLKSILFRLSLIFSYLGFVGLQNALYTDIHNIVFALLPFMLTIWAIYQKKWRWYWFFLFITIGFQESLAAVVVMLGIFLLLRQERNTKMGILTIAFGLVYGLFTTKILIPFLSGSQYSYQPEMPTVWSEWLIRFFYPPELKVKTILLSLATFGFLPIASLPALPLLLEHFLERFVLNSAATRWDLGLHYNALLSPIMFLASLELLIKFQGKKILRQIIPFWGLITILIVIFLHRFYLHGPLMLATHPVFYEQTKNAKFMDPFISQIPKTGLLMTQNNIAAHFTHGQTILLNMNYKKIKPDVIALDLRTGQNPNNFYPLSESRAQMLAASLLSDINYLKKEVIDSQLIFVRR
jgi:uncharacterized membrane protein